MKIIMHIDVNSAYLSWSAIDLLDKGYKFDIRNSYAVITGAKDKNRGIIVAASIPAKKIGIKTAETIYSAKKKCPSLKVYLANFPLYEKMSKNLFELLNKYTPDVEIASIDECYLDFTPIAWKYKNYMEFASMLQKEILNTLGFTVNIGIGNNMLCAKMASDFEKPNKIHTLFFEEYHEKMYHKPVSTIHGIGKKTVEKLNELGIKTVSNLAEFNLIHLKKIFKNQAEVLINLAKGIDNTEIDPHNNELKGIGNETTFIHEIDNYDKIKETLLFLAEKVSFRIRKEKKYAFVVAITIKDERFVRKSKQKKLINSTDNTKTIFDEAVSLFNDLWDKEPIRLIGIRLDQLSDKTIYQSNLFEDINKVTNDNELDKILDNLNEKFGKKIIKRAGTYRKEE